jgi:hypothetical protein
LRDSGQQKLCGRISGLARLKRTISRSQRRKICLSA